MTSAITAVVAIYGGDGAHIIAAPVGLLGEAAVVVLLLDRMASHGQIVVPSHDSYSQGHLFPGQLPVTGRAGACQTDQVSRPPGLEG